MDKIKHSFSTEDDLLKKDLPKDEETSEDYLDDDWQAEKGFFHEIRSEGGLPKEQRGDEGEEEASEK